jgi:hypothetical protein
MWASVSHWLEVRLWGAVTGADREHTAIRVAEVGQCSLTLSNLR